VQQEPSLKGKIGVLGPLKGPDGTTYDYDTGGNDGMFVIPKSTVKTVADLKKVLSFMNAMCSPDVENLLVYGVKNQNYKLVNGYAVPINTNNTKDTAQLNDLEELSPLLQSSETLTAKPTPLDKEVDNVENVVDMKYLLTDPTASLSSKTEAQDGTQLTNLLNTAMMKFIAGQTDVSGIQAANQQWLKDGGQKMLSELEAAYAKYK
jgi:putative aldouronate transport system substrate-binding protein